MIKKFTNHNVKICKQDLCYEANGKLAKDINLVITIAISAIAVAYIFKTLTK